MPCEDEVRDWNYVAIKAKEQLGLLEAGRIKEGSLSYRSQREHGPAHTSVLDL